MDDRQNSEKLWMKEGRKAKSERIWEIAQTNSLTGYNWAQNTVTSRKNTVTSRKNTVTSHKTTVIKH